MDEKARGGDYFSGKSGHKRDGGRLQPAGILQASLWHTVRRRVQGQWKGETLRRQTLVSCVSFFKDMPTFPRWEAVTLGENCDYVDDFSPHQYYGNDKNDAAEGGIVRIVLKKASWNVIWLGRGKN